jgi:hypothetical protein
MRQEIRKVLSANDVGETGSHQAGILVPKDPHILAFFPELDRGVKNPRTTLVVREKSDSTRWVFSFIYYNNRLFGGTRNEYRLTCMTQYLRSIAARVGDELVFSVDENASYVLDLIRASRSTPPFNEEGILVLSGGWTVINTR